MYTERRYGEITTYDTRAESYETVDKQKRYRQIVEVLSDGKERTAKEIAYILYHKGLTPTSERNFVSPRLTELCKKGIVEHAGKKKCAWTNKNVTVFRLRGGKNESTYSS